MPVKIPTKSPALTRQERLLALAQTLARDEGMYAPEVAARIGVSTGSARNLLGQAQMPVIKVRSPDTGHLTYLLVHPDTARTHDRQTA